MILFLLSYLGGVLTILSPCILPVLPFVFARADRPFARFGLPMLAGMAVSFAAIATLAAVGGGWAVQANQAGRIAAMALLALFGLTLLLPGLAERLTRPLVALGDRLSHRAEARGGVGSAALLGVATGLLWAPCAGPILGLVLSGAVLQGPTAATGLLLLCYALGAATSLALALLAGGRVFRAMKGSIGAGEWIRRGLGLAVLAGVLLIALGLDRGFLTRLSVAGTNRIEQGLLSGIGMPGTGTTSDAGLGDEGPMPSLDGATAWLNSPPLSRENLRGKVVLVDFWTYSCINCIRTMPYLRAWWQRYRDDGLVIIGVHAPEFAFEKDIGNVRQAVRDLGIGYPVAVDNDYAIWSAFGNSYWPAHYFIDARGRVRYHHFGEGNYEESERVIQQLLAEASPGRSFERPVAARGEGVEAASAGRPQSPETYIGYARSEGAVSVPEHVPDRAERYRASPRGPDEWGLAGLWTVGREQARLDEAGGHILYRFHGRDLHLVLGPAKPGQPVRFRVTVDGRAPGENHGTDIDAQGNGVIRAQRLYQLVRLKDARGEHDFAIEFLDPGAEAYSFTFG